MARPPGRGQAARRGHRPLHRGLAERRNPETPRGPRPRHPPLAPVRKPATGQGQEALLTPTSQHQQGDFQPIFLLLGSTSVTAQLQSVFRPAGITLRRFSKKSKGFSYFQRGKGFAVQENSSYNILFLKADKHYFSPIFFVYHTKLAIFAKKLIIQSNTNEKE